MQNNEDRGSLADKFRDFGAAPSDALWESISEQLGEKKKRRIAAWWWWTSGLAATLVALIVLLGPEKQQRNAAPASARQPLPAAEKPAHDDRSNAPADQVPAHAAFAADAAPQHTPPAPQQRQPAEEPQPNGPLPTPKNNELTQHNQPPIEPITAPAPNDSLTAVVPPSENDSLNSDPADNLMHDSSIGYQLPEPPPAFQSKWSIALHGGGARGFAAIVQGTDAEASFDNLGSGTSFLPSNAPSSASVVELHQYWSAGLTVTRQFTASRFSIESGIEAGWFRSGTFKKMSYAPSAAYASGSATTFTLALPVSVQMRLLSTRKFKLSAGAGVINHLPFYQRVSTVPQSAENMELIENSRSMTYIPAAQFNLSLQYTLSKRLYLEMRPQLRHYFEFPYKEKDPGAAPYILDNWWGGTVGLGWKF